MHTYMCMQVHRVVYLLVKKLALNTNDKNSCTCMSQYKRQFRILSLYSFVVYKTMFKVVNYQLLFPRVHAHLNGEQPFPKFLTSTRIYFVQYIVYCMCPAHAMAL